MVEHADFLDVLVFVRCDDDDKELGAFSVQYFDFPTKYAANIWIVNGKVIESFIKSDCGDFAMRILSEKTRCMNFYRYGMFDIGVKIDSDNRIIALPKEMEIHKFIDDLCSKSPEDISAMLAEEKIVIQGA